MRIACVYPSDGDVIGRIGRISTAFRPGGHGQGVQQAQPRVKTILVVDDELASAEVLSLILEEEGYRTFCAADGQQGLARVREVRPQLVVLDLVMPVMSGGEMARALREGGETASIRILMNSGLSEDAVREQVTTYDAFLRKPYNVDVALEMIRRLLQE